MDRFTSLRLVALLSLALLGACSGNGGVRDDVPATPVVQGDAAAPAPTTTAIAPQGTAAVDAAPADAAIPDTATQADETATTAVMDASDTQDPALQAVDDYAAIYGRAPYDPIADPTLPAPAQLPQSYDPWEPFNRRVYTFNDFVDRTIAKPLAEAYVKVVPRVIRLGVSNFFSNLGQPVSALNALLQGKPKQSAQSLGRFALNTTLGIGGIFDPASDAGLPNRSEDFGQTLGVWGWETSRYVQLPLFGPRTVRDSFGLIGDAPLSPIRPIEDDKTRIFLQGLQLVDVRTQLFAVDSMRKGAIDEYALVRDAWLQRRNYQIFGDRMEQDESLPDYLREDTGNPTVPADAMPIIPGVPGN